MSTVTAAEFWDAEAGGFDDEPDLCRVTLVTR